MRNIEKCDALLVLLDEEHVSLEHENTWYCQFLVMKPCHCAVAPSSYTAQEMKMIDSIDHMKHQKVLVPSAKQPHNYRTSP